MSQGGQESLGHREHALVSGRRAGRGSPDRPQGERSQESGSIEKDGAQYDPCRHLFWKCNWPPEAIQSQHEPGIPGKYDSRDVMVCRQFNEMMDFDRSCISLINGRRSFLEQQNVMH